MRYALGIEYDGSGFLGWQRLTQPGVESTGTLQAALETALTKVASAPVATTCAGRTDAGVHARCNVVHFDSDATRGERAWLLGTTSLLPPGMAVRWCRQVAPDFNARFSARARRYRYSILNRVVRPALGRQYLAWTPRPLDAAAMHRAAQALVGRHDFTTFRSAHCQANDPIKTLDRLAVRREDDLVLIEAEARSFLHHQVRSMVGTLALVGLGQWSESQVAEALAAKDRAALGLNAPAEGLYFVEALYPED